MRLIFSTSNHMNTDISNEQGHKLYSISTPRAKKQVTTVTKYPQSSHTTMQRGEVMGIIEWDRRKKTVIRFNGQEVDADTMLEARRWSSSGRYFTGPDRLPYKWKLGQRYCWRAEGSNVELAKFHKKNLGFLKPSHSPYLNVSSAVTHMVDHIVITYIYAEALREAQQARQSRTSNSSYFPNHQMMAAAASVPPPAMPPPAMPPPAMPTC
ncbi:hypothetical protein HYDPIDRAFT_141546 [Hydnomerulius pinastri MD-312]|uniref:DUF6593 domain-containing protein n=1 Tax=Hydnomerulius pinastri MD-312 TaxID=994086 RepID=A0A0C9VYB4_9AGAM|nr:hypothetical protein HYDPIDRAFT_141546 [Hydnomerulius pinastri MD-312]